MCQCNSNSEFPLTAKCWKCTNSGWLHCKTFKQNLEVDRSPFCFETLKPIYEVIECRTQRNGIDCFEGFCWKLLICCPRYAAEDFHWENSQPHYILLFLIISMKQLHSILLTYYFRYATVWYNIHTMFGKMIKYLTTETNVTKNILL